MGGPTVKTVTPGKDIVASVAEEVRSEVLQFVEDGVKELALDLDGVGVVDPFALGVFIAAQARLKG